MKRLKRFLPFLPAALLIALLSGGLAACGESGAPQVASQLRVEDFQFSRLEGGTRLFTGTVYNPTDQPVEQAQITVSLLDEQNRQVGTSRIRVSDIAPRGSTAFRQPLDTDQDASGARVQSLMVL